jgi:Sigma-70, region 4
MAHETQRVRHLREEVNLYCGSHDHDQREEEHLSSARRHFPFPFLSWYHVSLVKQWRHVSRGKDVSLISRDQQIVAMKGEGKSYQQIADTFGITKARVSQIISRAYEDVSDDSYREGMRLDLEGKLAELNRLIASPGKVMVSPGGRIICHYVGDGTDAIDYSRPVYDEFVKVDAIKAYFAGLERLARMHAIDRPKAKERDE